MRVLSVVAASISLALGSVALADDVCDLTKKPGVSRQIARSAISCLRARKCLQRLPVAPAC